MGNKITKRTNEWWDGAYGVLEASAKLALDRLGDYSNFVEVGDLISEGWLKSVRYADTDHERQWQAWYLRKHLRRVYCRLQWIHYLTKCRNLGNRLPFEVAERVESFDHDLACVDLWQDIRQFCTEEELEIIRMRVARMTYREIGHVFGLSAERIRQRLTAIRNKLISGGIGHGQSATH
jgi:RNA polymerase sigma factor (sigma-70 family)